MKYRRPVGSVNKVGICFDLHNNNIISKGLSMLGYLKLSTSDFNTALIIVSQIAYTSACSAL